MKCIHPATTFKRTALASLVLMGLRRLSAGISRDLHLQMLSKVRSLVLTSARKTCENTRPIQTNVMDHRIKELKLAHTVAAGAGSCTLHRLHRMTKGLSFEGFLLFEAGGLYMSWLKVLKFSLTLVWRSRLSAFRLYLGSGVKTILIIVMTRSLIVAKWKWGYTVHSSMPPSCKSTVCSRQQQHNFGLVRISSKNMCVNITCYPKSLTLWRVYLYSTQPLGFLLVDSRLNHSSNSNTNSYSKDGNFPSKPHSSHIFHCWAQASETVIMQNLPTMAVSEFEGFSEQVVGIQS